MRTLALQNRHRGNLYDILTIWGESRGVVESNVAQMELCVKYEFYNCNILTISRARGRLRLTVDGARNAMRERADVGSPGLGDNILRGDSSL